MNLSVKQTSLKSQSTGNYKHINKKTQCEIENALRNASDSATGENITTGMVIQNPADPKAINDKGAVFNVGADGKSLVQVLPNGGNVDPEIAASIQKEFSNYSWSNEQLGKVSPMQEDPNAGLNTITPATNGCVTAECAAGVLPAHSEMRTTSQIQSDLNNRICSIAVGSAVNAIVPGSLVLKPVVDSLGKFTGWVATQSFDQSLAGGSSVLVCSN